jgi:5'-3' exonuclease
MTTEQSTPKIALIDADFLAYSVGFACEDDPDPRMAKNRLTEWLTDIVYMDLQCDDYVAYTTGPGNFRYEVAKTVPYKGNRKDMKRPRYLDELKEHLRKLGAIETKGIEADDAVAICNAASPGKFIVVHVDKDLNQLQGLHYNPNKCELYEVTEFEAAYNFWIQVLTGDRVDNIPGLAGIGPKKAEKILKDCKTAEEMEQAAWKAYQDKGHGYDYFVEQGQLLWLQRYEGEVWLPTLEKLY